MLGVSGGKCGLGARRRRGFGIQSMSDTRRRELALAPGLDLDSRSDTVVDGTILEEEVVPGGELAT